MILIEIGLHPDREKLCAEVACFSRIEVQLAPIERIGKVEVFVDEALRRIGVGVDDDCVPVNEDRVRLGLWRRSRAHSPSERWIVRREIALRSIERRGEGLRRAGR